MHPDGSGIRNVTNHPARDSDPCWAPDGERIAFLSDRDGSDQLYVLHLHGGDVTKLTNAPGNKFMPAWSPDGQQIAFCIDDGSSVFIYVVGSRGGEPRNLTEGMAPSWSPDGKTLAFNRGQLPHIWLVDSNGDNARSMGPAAWGELSGKETLELLFRLLPVWSPEGKRLLYTKVLPGLPRPETSSNYEVFVVDVAAPEPRRLTTNESRDMGNSWSPDGKKIVFTSERDGNMEIYVMNVDGSDPEPVNLTQNRSNDRSAAWSPLVLSSAKQMLSGFREAVGR